MPQPEEGKCERCQQTRPLFIYELNHSGHIDPHGFTCRWCNRTQPMLCVRCWSNERLEEETDPQLNREAAMFEHICVVNAALARRSERDKATVDSIAAVSGMAAAVPSGTEESGC